MLIHFIGIGGIGVSALAKYYLQTGHQVSGSDLAISEITEALEKMGAKITIGRHKAGNIPANADLVVFSPAVKPNNPEFLRAQKYKLQTKSYPAALGELTKKYFTIAVSGTHGKSTTTAMLSLLLLKAGFDPTVIVGTKLKEFGDSTLRRGSGSNCRVGKGQYLVIEADEHFASFLNYHPQIIVLTNIEADHLDFYKNINNILKTFKEYIGHLPENGQLVANENDGNILKIIKNVNQKTIFYSLNNPDAQKLKNVLRVPGTHNISNALAALAAARILNIPDAISLESLSEFQGTWRRFDIKEVAINGKAVTLVSDYGHHPTEVQATLAAAREKYPNKKIWCVFQPHQYQRTYYLFNSFVKVFKKAPVDRVIITDIYDVAGREEKKIKKKVSAEKLVEAIKRENVAYLSKKKILDFLKTNLQGGEILIIMGAGDIYDLTKTLEAEF